MLTDNEKWMPLIVTEDTPSQPLAVEASNEDYLDRKLRNQRRMDAAFRGLTRLLAIGLLGLLLLMIMTLVAGSMPAIKAFGWKFFTSTDWDPVAEQFGAMVPLYGTLVTSFIALAIAVPISFGIALFLTELTPRFLKVPLGIAVELLAAIPSIIYGMWGLFVFAPFFAKNIQPWMTQNLGELPLIGVLFKGPSMGIGMLTASLILAVMVIPFISAVMRDVFELTPSLLKESAYGLGATTWEVISKIVVPHSKVGVVGGVMLGLGRALGETMAVTFVIGNSHELSASLMMPGNTISSALANEFTEAVGEIYPAALIELGLVLFLITFVVLAFAKFFLLRMQKREGAIT
ncbi:MAG: phosphate ABC transporter permease subunit PstC [Bdellovibrionales bacterium]|nr:phosphate ABC transporter permease subunit PstC [Bdellovibrionales bacterium]